MKPPHNQEFKELMQQLRALSKVSLTLQALKQKALILVEPFVNDVVHRPIRDKVWKYTIDGFADIDKDEYWEIDEWINSYEFILWIIKDSTINNQLHKDCVWELLKH